MSVPLGRAGRAAVMPLVAAGGAAAVLVLWLVHNHGLGTAGAGEEWIAVGRVTGLEGTYAALLTVLLLARVPWVDRLAGMPALAQWHRWVGQATISLLVVHALSIIWGYRMQAHATVWRESRFVVLDLPDMLAATVGLLAFVVVGVVSMRVVRRRISYETWHFIHLYIYLALALSFAHEYATGADFATHLDARVVWGGMYVVVLGLLLWYRFVAPIVLSWRHDLRVRAVVPEAGGSTSVHIAGRDLLAYRGTVGQFYIWRFLSRATWWEAHPFSLSLAPTDSSMRITVRAAGDFTDRIANLSVGCRVIAEGPFGTFVPHAGSDQPVLLVAAGAGIAPIRAMLDSLTGDVTLVYRARSDGHFALRREIDDIAASRGVRVHYLPGSRSTCADLCDPDVLQTFVAAPLREHQSYVCGPETFTQGVTEALRAGGVARSQIRTERFRL